jgi:hypothetical protein
VVAELYSTSATMPGGREAPRKESKVGVSDDLRKRGRVEVLDRSNELSAAWRTRVSRNNLSPTLIGGITGAPASETACLTFLRSHRLG